MEINTHSTTRPNSDKQPDASKVIETLRSAVSPVSVEVEVKKIEPKKANVNVELPTVKNHLPAALTSEVNFNKQLNLMVVNIIESESGEIVKTIPSKEIIDFMMKMRENRTNTGLLIDYKA